MIALCRDAGATIASEVLDTGGPGCAMVRREVFQLAMQDQRIGQIPEENAAVTESLADVTYWNLTVLTARS
jgi:hypothetical protein